MNSIERGMNDWHERFNVPKTESDSQFYKQFGDKYDSYSGGSSQRSMDEIMEECEAEFREKHKHDEYIESTYWDTNKEKIGKWDLLDYGSMFFRGRPTSRRIWTERKKNPDYVGPKPIDGAEQAEDIKNDPPQNNDQGGIYFTRDINL